MGNICSSCEEENKKPNAVIQPATTTNKHAMKEIILSEDTFLSACNNKIKTNDDSVKPPSNHTARLDYPLEISQQHSLTFDDSRSRIDFSKNDYRAFCLLIHRKQGAVLLYCTRKKRKPPHYQLPGGHVDDCEFKQLTKSLSNIITQEQLYYASRIGCAREVYEETGIDFRNRLDELLPMVLYKEDFKNETLINEFKTRIFFVCEVFDEDFPRAVRVNKGSLYLVAAKRNCTRDCTLQIDWFYYAGSNSINEYHAGGCTSNHIEHSHETHNS